MAGDHRVDADARRRVRDERPGRAAPRSASTSRSTTSASGYSSLAYLERLPVEVLKVDRSFVQGVGQRADSTAIATAIVSLARALGLHSVAEGIETVDQLAELRNVGCEMGQGYLFGAAQPAPAYGADPASTIPAWGLLGATPAHARSA